MVSATAEPRARRAPGVKALLLSLSALVLLSACALAPPRHAFRMPAVAAGDEPAIVWPAPPEVPRYAFIGHLYGESNRTRADEERRGFARFMAAVVGLDGQQGDSFDLVQPQQVCSDGRGRVYVADTGRQAVIVFDEKLGEFFVWNETNLNIPFLSPVGVACAAEAIWVTDSELSLVYRLDRDGSMLGTIERGVLVRPTGISHDAQGERFFVSDTGADDIKVFDKQGSLIDVWGNARDGEVGLNGPTFVAYHDDRLYVADSLNARIQVFEGNGDYRGTLGERGLYIGNLTRPKGIALDSDGNVYVTESYYDHLLIFNAQGELLLAMGGSGVEPGQFLQPTGLWIDGRDRIFVSDMLNRRISMFQYLGSN